MEKPLRQMKELSMKTYLGLFIFFVLILAYSGMAFAQADPGATVITHQETIPNPVFGSTFRVASSCKTVQTSCAWENSSTWVAGRIPDANTQVIVDGNVRINDQTATALEIGIYPGGTLSFNLTANTKLRTGDIVAFAGGTLLIGTENQPIGDAFTAEVVIRDLPFPSSDLKQFLRGIIAVDGTVKIHGMPLGETFIQAAAEPKKNTTVISLAISAIAAGWKVGDPIVIPKSSQCRIASGPCPEETEDRTITAISSDGKTVTLSSSLQFDHPGARDNAGNLNFLPYILNEGRNVIIHSENPNGIRGHILLHHRADVDIRYALIQDLGRTNIQDLGPSNQKGRYPLHAHHLIGPQTIPANGYQFTLIGNVVDFGPENYQQNRKWGIAIHESHFGLIERNICDLASGAGIVAEDASETGNWFRKNFVTRIVGGNGARTQDPDPGDGSKLGRAGVAFWFNGGGNNFFEDNVAADVAECTYCYGFKFDNVYNGTITIPQAHGADPFEGGGMTVDSYTIGINHFLRNQVYAVPNGLTIWWVCTEWETPRNACSSVVKDFRVWHHHRWGYFAYETHQMTLDGFTHRGDQSVLANPNESVIAIYHADYMTSKEIIRNADLQGAARAIVAPAHRGRAGSSGQNVGITTIENSFLSAGTNIYIPSPSSTNGAGNLLPQTTIIRNVRFDHPSTRQGSNIVMTAASEPSNNLNNLNLQNDVWVDNYNSLPGVVGDNLYMIPTYLGTSRCDNGIGDCTNNITTRYPDIVGAYIYPLRASTPPPPPTAPPTAPSALQVQ